MVSVIVMSGHSPVCHVTIWHSREYRLTLQYFQANHLMFGHSYAYRQMFRHSYAYHLMVGHSHAYRQMFRHSHAYLWWSGMYMRITYCSDNLMHIVWLSNVHILSEVRTSLCIPTDVQSFSSTSAEVWTLFNVPSDVQTFSRLFLTVRHADVYHLNFKHYNVLINSCISHILSCIHTWCSQFLMHTSRRSNSRFCNAYFLTSWYSLTFSSSGAQRTRRSLDLMHKEYDDLLIWCTKNFTLLCSPLFLTNKSE